MCYWLNRKTAVLTFPHLPLDPSSSSLLQWRKCYSSSLEWIPGLCLPQFKFSVIPFSLMYLLLSLFFYWIIPKGIRAHSNISSIFKYISSCDITSSSSYHSKSTLFHRQISRQSCCTHYFHFLKKSPLHTSMISFFITWHYCRHQWSPCCKIQCSHYSLYCMWLIRSIRNNWPFSPPWNALFSEFLGEPSSKCFFYLIFSFLKVYFALSSQWHFFRTHFLFLFSLYTLCLSDPIYPSGLTFQTSVNISNISV